MPLLEIVQTTHVNATVRLEQSTAALVNQYAAFLRAPADEVVDKALAYVFSKDRDFQDFLRTPDAAHVAPSLRVRRLVQNGSAPQCANGSAKSAKAPEVVHDPRPRSQS